MHPIVDTSCGTLRGVREADLCIFRGIPYARPPVGALRFQPPEPPAAWTGVRDATAFGPASLQPPDLLSSMLGFESQPTNEDCLTLNVWTPGTDGARRPVLVWIHGGAFTFGSGARALTDGAALARRGDAVVVSINYRLGVLGFLSLADFGVDARAHSPNLGMLDQIAALEWVRREIAAFGGDPDTVTIFGQSAGAMSVAALLAMPRARGLFRRAVLQSGAGNFVSDGAQAARVAAAVLDALGIEPAQAARLHAVPGEQLLEAQLRVMMQPPRGLRGLPFQPAVDGMLLPADPFERIRAGDANGVSVLIGTTRDEMRLFDFTDPQAKTLDADALVRRCERNIPGTDGDGTSRGRRAVETYRAARAARGDDVQPPALWCAIESDRLFRYPAMRLAELQRAVQPAVYAYLFTWPSPYGGGALGACHAIDLPFVFATHDDPRIAPFAGDGPDARRLAARMQDAWLAFARDGAPDHGDLPHWPRYDPTRRATMVLGPECGVVEAPYEAERRFWEEGR